jgi:hypothetical protein
MAENNSSSSGGISDLTREDLAAAILEQRETIAKLHAKLDGLEAAGKDWAAITAAQALDAALTKSELSRKDAKTARMRELLQLVADDPCDPPYALITALLKEEP